MSDEQPPDDDRSDESNDDNPAEPTDWETPREPDRQPPIGSESPDRWPAEEPSETADSEGSHWLSRLLNLLDSLDRSSRESRSGRTDRGGRFDLDYDVSIGSGLDSIGSDSDRQQPPNRNSRAPRSGDSRRGSSSGRSSRTRRHRSSLSTQHVTSRTYDDELLVTADVSGIDPESITVGFNDGRGDDTKLVVGVDDRELERVDVPWERSSVEADARIKNGVLTVTVSRDDLDESGTGATSGAVDSGGDRNG